MILKHLLGLSFEDGYRVEHQHQRLYLYFADSKELWSYCVEDAAARFTRGYVTTTDGVLHDCYADLPHPPNSTAAIVVINFSFFHFVDGFPQFRE